MTALCMLTISVNRWRASWSPRAALHALCCTEPQRKRTSLLSSTDHLLFPLQLFATQFLLEKHLFANREVGKQSWGEKWQPERPPSLMGTGQPQVPLPPTPVPKFPAVASPQYKRVASSSSLASDSVFGWTDGLFASQCHQLQKAWHCTAHT